MKTLFIVLSLVTVVGCSKSFEDVNGQARELKHIELDKQYFRECMELAAGLPHYANGDQESTMVEDCDDRAYWQAKKEARALFPVQRREI